MRKAEARLGDFVLGPMSLRIGRGEHVWVLGPSGAGKSTLVNLLAGFVPLTGGTLWLRKQDCSQLPAWKRGCGWVAQTPALFPHLTVAQNIGFGLNNRRMPNKQVVERWAQRLGVAHALSRAACLLSGGEAQRVALARALAPDPDILLLDEPFSALDDELTQRLQTLLHNLQEERALTVLHVTHRPDPTAPWGERCLTVAHGKLIDHRPDWLL